MSGSGLFSQRWTRFRLDPTSYLRGYATLSDIPRLRVDDLRESQDRSHVKAINEALKEPGVALISLQFPDTSSDYLKSLVINLGKHHKHGPPIEHSSTRGCFWDVKPRQETVAHQARSESSLNFPWHTDCSYESRPPQFFGLHVLHADRNGGGTLSALNAAQILRKLGTSAYETLSQPVFRIAVPPEFSKGIKSIDGSVISQPQESDNVHIRFRADIIQPLSVKAENALGEFNELLASRAETIEHLRVNLTARDLPDNTIVLMDNSRWLHARTEVKDLERHLRRLRWGCRDFGQENSTLQMDMKSD